MQQIGGHPWYAPVLTAGCWTIDDPAPFGGVTAGSCLPEFRRKVLDLVASARKVAELARLLGISDQTIYVW
ncbi:helix-turn-helix domain-containing protein [Streptomyces canus]|uniref:helix-turn-helix domain-containing protein n=1 Tax=Streptomyces canus TaxID=58343 RepID=UPI00324C88B7